MMTKMKMTRLSVAKPTDQITTVLRDMNQMRNEDEEDMRLSDEIWTLVVLVGVWMLRFLWVKKLMLK